MILKNCTCYVALLRCVTLAMELGIPTKSSASNPEVFLGAGDDTCTHPGVRFTSREREAGRLLVSVFGGFVWKKQIASTVHP